METTAQVRVLALIMELAAAAEVRFLTKTPQLTHFLSRASLVVLAVVAVQ
jgi:hypothetical protein